MKLFFKYNKNSAHKGFTVIEVMVSILIFSSPLIALMGIAGKGISATQAVSSETTAHYLAQEGLEVVRNVRDTNFVSGGAWDAGLSSCTQNTPCQVSYQGTNAPILSAPCSAVSNNPALKGCLVNQLTDGFFTDSAGNPSGFYREVYIGHSSATNPDEYLATSIVSWEQKNVPRSVVLETLLTKWQP